ADAPGISGRALQTIVQDYRAVQAQIRRLSRQYPEEVLQQLSSISPLSVEQLSDEHAVNAWVDELKVAVGVSKSGAHFSFTVRRDDEEKIFVPVVTSIIHGITRKVTLTPELFKSNEYREFCRLGATLKGLFESGAYVKRGEKTQPVSSFKEALDWLMADAMKGHYLQRYKGLGEMNPEQLWETTMDPNFRRMLRVTIEDAMGADQLFYTLMGDQVEPRRDFIESNALQVANLDV
ncbi:MAG: DNA gyrase subunit B, partial [Pseudomonadota bacterium]|nr:DNA gyrase subunit B [Pseudomonadota bacterium]